MLPVSLGHDDGGGLQVREGLGDDAFFSHFSGKEQKATVVKLAGKEKLDEDHLASKSAPVAVLQVGLDWPVPSELIHKLSGELHCVLSLCRGRKVGVAHNHDAKIIRISLYKYRCNLCDNTF